MTTISLDISLNSTGVTILKDKQFTHYLFTCQPTKIKGVNIIYFQYKYKDISTYSLREQQKLNDYNDISAKIINTIFKYIEDDDTVINIEGFSYSSKTSSIIDIISLSTLIKSSLIALKQPNTVMNIISPTSNKKKTGSGKATKKDVLLYLLNLELDSPFLEYIKQNKEQIFKNKTLPNGVSDISDSILLCL